MKHLREPRFGCLCFSIVFLIVGATHAAVSPPVPQPPSRRESEPSRPPAKDAAAFFQEGIEHLKHKKYADALNSFSEVVRRAPDNAEAHSNLGYCYRKLKNYKLALEHYDRALQLKPSLATAREYRGEALAELGRLDEARQELEALRKLDPKLAARLEKFLEHGAEADAVVDDVEKW
jgi:tetratricopeptide (TPR) repeat protein